MNRRLEQFLALENLTSAQLADKLEIGRPRLSHILAGRNMPSYEFIKVFLEKFPHISPEWLITGKGKPYKSQIPGTATPSGPDPAPNPAPNSAKEPLQEPGENIASDVLFPDNVPQSLENKAVTGGLEELFPDENETETSSDEQTPVYGHRQRSKIKRITILYEDGSFEEITPRQ